MRTVLTFYEYGPDNGTALLQFHDASIIPDINDLCYLVTTRDENGSYAPDGKPQRRWNGTVRKREFSYEVHGKSSQTYNTVIYVRIYLDCH